MILKQLLKNKFSNKVLLTIISIIALVGLADSVYLTADYYLGTGVKCLIVEGCEIVLTSVYSKIFGIPLAVFGVVFYAGMFVLAGIADTYRDKLYFRLLLIGGITGFIASLIFLYIQIFILKALCFYCVTSAISSTLIFIAAVILNKRPDNDLAV